MALNTTLINSKSFIDIHSHSSVREEKVLKLLNLDLNRLVRDCEPGLFYSAGYHPWYLNTENLEKAEAKLDAILDKPNVLAIGECGLDSVCDTDREWQKKYFLMQAKKSEKRNLPMIIHCVKEYNAILKIRKDNKLQQPWIFHGFGGSVELYNQIVQSGCYISIGEKIFKPGKKFLNSLQNMDINTVFIETDESDKEPEDIYTEVSKKLNIKMEVLASEIKTNFVRLFGTNLNAK